MGGFRGGKLGVKEGGLNLGLVLKKCPHRPYYRNCLSWKLFYTAWYIFYVYILKYNKLLGEIKKIYETDLNMYIYYV